MSLCNVWLDAERVLVGVDTGTATPGVGRGEASKMLPLCHARLILAGRGIVPFLGAVFAGCHELGGDLDSIEGQMPNLMSGAMQYLVSQAHIRQLDFDITQQELFLVGWSPRRGRMIGFSYREFSAEGLFKTVPIEPWVIGGWGDPAVMGYPPVPSTPEAMEKLARAQVSYFRDAYPNDGFGGRLLIAELTRDTLKVYPQCSL